MTECRFPSGGDWTVGILSRTVSDLCVALNVEFRDDLDDLDYFTAGWLQSRSVGPILLLRYEHSPGTGVEVIVDSKVRRDDAVDALKQEFGIEPSEWGWTADHQTYAESLAEAERLTREAMEARAGGDA